MLLYIGAGTDMSPLLLPYERFVFIDQCPSNTTGHMGWRKDVATGKNVPVPYKNFYKNVRQNIRRLGFSIEHTCVTSGEWEFTLTGARTCRLLYFIDTVYPKLSEHIARVVAQCDALFVRGYTKVHIQVAGTKDGLYRGN